MATVPSFTTFVAGNKLTAAQMNANVRDAGNFFVAPPAVKVHGSAAQSIPSGVYTALTWDTEDTDTDNMHSTSANTDRFTAVTAGWYLVTANVEFVSNATGGRYLKIVDNTGANLCGAGVSSPGSSPQSLSVSVLTYMAVGAWVNAGVWQGSGGALSTSGNASSNGACNFSAVWVHS